jgi:hypothetical protein
MGFLISNNGYPVTINIDNISNCVFLAILGLGWHTFFEGIKKGIDKLGITSIIENATGSATEIAKNASRD